MRRKLALFLKAADGAAAPLSRTKQVHARLLLASISISDDLRLLLLRSYASGGDFTSAYRLLDGTPRPASALLYNAVIRAHARRLDLPASVALFATMRRSATPPDAHTFACVVRACADCSRPGTAKIVHGIASSSGISSHPVVSSALVSAYSKFLLVDSARHVFDGLHDPDLVLWNSMMSGYGYREMWLQGLQLFYAMRRTGEDPDGYTMVSLVSSFWDPQALAFGQAVHGVCIKGGYDSGHHVRSALVSMYFRAVADSLLSACASTATISCSKEIHCYAVRLGVDEDIKVSSSLMDAYAKCGFAELGYSVFRRIAKKNSVMYNMVISNLGSHGFALKAIQVHDEMVRDKIRPDGATFSALLAACCHSGLLDEGWKLFTRMRDEFHIVVEMEHYVYMVRLLATFNQLKEAYDLIHTMPMPPDCGVWGALLWGCCVHRDSSLGDVVGCGGGQGWDV